MPVAVSDWRGFAWEGRHFGGRWSWNVLPSVQGWWWRNLVWLLSSRLPHELPASTDEESTGWWLEVPHLYCTFLLYWTSL